MVAVLLPPHLEGSISSLLGVTSPSMASLTADLSDNGVPIIIQEKRIIVGSTVRWVS